MDTQSTSHSKHSPSSTPKEGHGKNVPQKRIQSVEPELEPLGAVGGEGISYLPETERSNITVSPTIPDTFSAQKKNQALFYNTYPISPVTEFTDKYLEKVSGEAVALAKHLQKKIEKIFVKMAALRVQTLVIKMIRGEDSNDETRPIIKNINDINSKCVTLGQDGIIALTNPHVLWPIDQTECTKYDFLAIGQLEAKAYYATFDKYKNPTPRTEKEESKRLSDLVNTLKTIKRYDEELISSSDKPEEKIDPTYVLLPEESVQSIEPDLREAGEKYGLFILSHDLTHASSFEEKLLACYNLHMEINTGDGEDEIIRPIKPSFFLDVYKERLKDCLNKGELTVFQAQQIACTWMITLTKNFTYYQNARLANILFNQTSDTKKGKNTKRKKGKKESIANKAATKIKTQTNQINCDQCLKLTMWAKDNGFLRIAAHETLGLLFKCVTREVHDIRSAPSNIKKLAVEIMETAVHVAIGAKQKWRSNSTLIILCEQIGDKEKFDEASSAASQYSFFSILIGIWHDLGLSEKNHPWIKSKNLRPEYVIEYLIKMVEQKDDLLAMEKYIDASVKAFHAQHNTNDIPTTNCKSPIFLLYYHIIGKEEAAKELIPCEKKKWPVLFKFLSLIAHGKFEESAAFVENALPEDNKKMSASEKELKNSVLPLLALVYKRLADKVSCDAKKTEHLNKALSYLFKCALSHKELYLSIAKIQEQLNELKNAYASYTTLEEHCKTFPKESAENCQLQFISQAKEQLTDRMLNSPDNTPQEESVLQKSEKDDIPITRKKPKQNIITTRITPQLTPNEEKKEEEEEEEEEIIVPFASLRMNKPSDADFKTKEPAERIQNLTLKSEECVQEDNDTNWTLVRKKTAPPSRIPHEITNEAFETAMSATKHSRHLLSMKLLHSANIDYDNLWSEYDRLYNKTDNIIIKQMVFQNKMWSIRHKTFNTLSLGYESKQNNVPADNIKTKLRAEILKSLYSNVENIIKTLTSETLPETWRNKPEIIFNLKDFALFLDTSAPLRFRIQFGAQCSTMSHIMRDISFDLPNGSANMDYATSLFDREDLTDFYDLATLFYNFRDRINPEHSSNRAINY